ncbi:MAG: flagellar protein FlaG [Pseudomonadota bacterium]
MNVSSVEASNAMAGAVGPVNVPRQEPCRHDQEAGNAAVSVEKVKQMISEMQSQIDMMNISLKFSTYGERGEKIAVVVADKETGEVIREIPSKEIQNLYAKMSELAGMIFNKKA